MPKPQAAPPVTLARTHRTLPIALLRAREAVMERFRPMLHRIDVTEQQWRVLRVLDEADSMDASDLAKGAAILAPSLSRILKALEARGFIAVRKDPDDGRRARISLSDAGASFLADAAAESAATYAEIETLVGRDKVEALLDEIDGLIVRLSDRT